VNVTQDVIDALSYLIANSFSEPANATQNAMDIIF
jgi:hypothetical protein